MFSALSRFGRAGAPAGRSLEAAVRALLPDVWYDPSDTATLFQDSAGTTPVTAVEQAVGLMLDKSRGLVLGSELVTNGDFSQGSTGWTLDAGWSVSGGVASKTAGSAANITQTLALTGGVMHLVTYTVTAISGGGVFPRLVGSTVVDGVTRTTTGTFTEYVTAPAGMTSFAIRGQSTTAVTIDNISVRELPGAHAYHTPGDTTTRSTYSRRVNLLTETEFRNGLTDAPIRGGNISASTMTGYLGAIAFTAPDAYAYKSGAPASTAVTFSVVVETGDGNPPSFGGSTGSDARNTFALVVRGGVVNPLTYTTTNLGNGRYQVSCAVTTGTGTDHNGVTKYVSNDARAFKVTAYSLVPADLAALPYQRVNTATDYDSDASKFPSYLRCDGVNDGLQTNAIDFSGTDKMFVSAGVRKLSDAAVAQLIGLSDSVDVNNGSFMLYLPGVAGGSLSYTYASKGSTARVLAATGNQYPAPITSVLSGISAISTDTAVMRVDGAQAAISTLDQGTGNYGNYPLYLFRRGGASLPFNGWFYGAVIKGATLTAAQIAIVERYNASKTKTVVLA